MSLYRKRKNKIMNEMTIMNNNGEQIKTGKKAQMIKMCNLQIKTNVVRKKYNTLIKKLTKDVLSAENILKKYDWEGYKMKKVLATIIAVGAAAAMLGAFPAAADEAKTLKVGVSWAHCNDALFYSWRDGLKEIMEETAPDHGYDSVEMVNVVAEDDAQKQASDISDLITQDCDVIIAYAFDNQAIASSVKEAKDAGIPLVLWDRDEAEGAEPQADLFIGLDTYNQAYLAGKEFFQMLKDQGVEATDIISIMGATNDNNALNRQKGFEDAAKEFDLEISQTVPSDWNSEKALTGFTAAFQAHPDCNVVLIASDFIVTSVQTVLEANDAWYPVGEDGHVYICSQDGFPTGVKFMQEGYMDYSGMYNVDGMCQNFADSVYDLIDGTYEGDAKLYTDPMIVAASDIDNLDLWGANYMEEAAE